MATVYNTANGNKTIAEMRNELYNASNGMPEWQNASESTVVAKYGELTGRSPVPMLDAASAAKENQIYSTGNGYKSIAQMRQEIVNASNGMPEWQAAGTDQILAKYGQLTKQTPTYLEVALPYQINPLVWDSMSNTAKNVILGAAEGGQTKSGAWTSEDYLTQLDASRPKGTAPTRVNFNWSSGKSYF